MLPQVEKFPDLAAEKAAWEKEQAGMRKAHAVVRARAGSNSGVRGCGSLRGVSCRHGGGLTRAQPPALHPISNLPIPLQAQKRSEKEEKEEQRRQQDMLGAWRRSPAEGLRSRGRHELPGASF